MVAKTRTCPAGAASWAILLLVMALFTWPLLSRPTLPRGSDVSYHAQWGEGFVESLGAGVAYPRWIEDANRGYGAPIFIVYPPLGYYALALASLASDGIVGALRLVLVAATFLTALSFFFAARDMLAGGAGALLGAGLYVLLPYHAIDLYDRFAFAEFLAFVWFPWLFFAVRRLAHAPDPGAWLTLLVAYAGLVLTHLMTAYLVLFLLGPYALVHVGRSRRWRALGGMAAAGGAALLCAAVYLLPLLVQRGELNLEWFAEPHYDWRRNLVYRDEVAFGFRADVTKPWANAAATTQAVLTCVAGLLLWLARGGRAHTDERTVALCREGLIWVALSFFALYLQTPLSAPFWAIVPGLASAQFPWRFSAFQLLGGAFAAACAVGAWARVSNVDVRPSRGSRRSAGARRPQGAARLAWLGRPWATPAVLVLAAAPALVVSARVSGARAQDVDEALLRSPTYRFRVVQEFMPRGVPGWREWTQQPFPAARYSLAGEGRLERLSWSAEARRLRVDAPAATRLRLHSFDYPGWQARLDGRPAPIDSQNAQHRIELDVPAGSHEIEVVLVPTWDRRVGALLSASGLLFTTTLAVLALRRRRTAAGSR